MNKKSLITLLKWTISLGLIALLYSRINWSVFFEIIQNSNPILLIVGFLIIFVNTLMCSYKWKLFLKEDSLDQPFIQLFISYWIGGFVSLFLPSNIGGDSYRIYDLGSKTKEGVRSFTSVFAERLSGFLALAIIGLVGGILGSTLLENKLVIVILLIFLAIFTAILLLVLDPRFVKLSLKITRLNRISAITKAHQSIVDTFQKYGKNNKLVFKVMLLSALFYFGYILAIYSYSEFLGFSYPFYIFAIFVPIIALFEALPISIYGLGIRDTAYVYFFSFIGVPTEHALAIAFTHLFMNVFFASLGGFLLMFRKHHHSREKA